MLAKTFLSLGVVLDMEYWTEKEKAIKFTLA